MAPLQQPNSQHSRNLRRGLLQDGGGSPVKRNGIHPPERSASFHGKPTTQRHQQIMRRPKTQPDLIAAAASTGYRTTASPFEVWRHGSSDEQQIKKVLVPSKILVNVNVQRSLGALQVMASTDWTVDQLVAATIKQYIKEGRRPPLPSTEPSAFGLHYSQFSLQSLDPMEKLIGLGSRNFFLCPKPTTTALATNEASKSSSSSSETLPAASSSCSKEADKESKIAIPWLRFMDFLL